MKKFGFECKDNTRMDTWMGYKEQYIFRFENNFGASVVRHKYSYGYEEGLYELAVLKFRRDDWDICYDTEITDDVCGYRSEEEVEDLLKKIKDLEPDHFFDWDAEYEKWRKGE